MAPEERPSSLSTVVLQLVGAAASVVVLMTLLGSVASWTRYDTLDLPNNAAIATLSQTTLLLVGATALFWPVVIGLLTAGACTLVRRHRYWRRRWVIVYVGTIVAAVVIFVVPALAGWPWWYWPLYAVCAGLLVLVTLTPLSTVAVGYMVFFAMIAVGAVVAAVLFIEPPTHLERATVFFDDRRPVVGFWIADTSDLLYVAPQFLGRNGPCMVVGTIVGLPHTHITRIRLTARVPVFPRDTGPQPKACPADK